MISWTFFKCSLLSKTDYLQSDHVECYYESVSIMFEYISLSYEFLDWKYIFWQVHNGYNKFWLV